MNCKEVGEEILKRYCTGLRFLTILPVQYGKDLDNECFPDSIACFPLVGLTIGTLAVLFTITLQQIVPQAVTAVCVIAFLALISNCLHLDGAADTADGLLSGRDRERSLAIMKDSRIGAMGAATLILLIVGKYAALSSISAENLVYGVFFMPFGGRIAFLIIMAVLPYARAEGGIGGLFYSPFAYKYAFVWSAIFCLLLVICWGVRGAVVFAIYLGTLFLLNRRCHKHLGGATGDVFGAGCELSELMIALLITAVE